MLGRDTDKKQTYLGNDKKGDPKWWISSHTEVCMLNR
jgi:hypothetical protein